MSKADQKQAKNQAEEQLHKNQANSDTAANITGDVLDTAKTTAKNLLPSVTTGYTDIQTTGGYDPSVLGRINAGYSDLADTGGVSDVDASAMRNRAMQAARSTYEIGQDEAARSAAATGGYGATGGAIQESLARKGSQAAAAAAGSADASIAGLRQSGKIAGIGGLSGVQQNMASNRLTATGGLANVYGMTESQVTRTVDQILQNYQQTGQLNNQDLTILTNLANQPGVFDKIVGTIGTLGGAAGGILTGIGSLGPK